MINLIFNFLINAKLTLIINVKYAIILNENENEMKSLDSRILFVTIVTKKVIINSIVLINKKNNKYRKNRKIKKKQISSTFRKQSKKNQ